MDSNFKSSLRESIEGILSLPEERAEKIASFIVDDLGAENDNDLKLITDQDLEQILKPIQKRKLRLAWTLQTPAGSRINEEARSSHPTTSENSIANQPLKENTNWAENFEVPWHKMPTSLMKALNSGTRPLPAQRREMVRVIANAIRKITLHPGKKALDLISKSITDQYCCLMDTLFDEIIADGFKYLSMQLRNRLEHLNRGNGDRKMKTTTISDKNNPAKRQSLSGRYGCCNWQPFISEEGEKSQEVLRTQLMKTYQDGPSSFNRDSIYEMLAETYPLQRKHINSGEGVQNILEKWPFLFMKRGLLDHFCELVGINLETRLQEALNNKATRIISYLKTIPTGSNKNLKQVISQVENSEDFGTLLILLSSYFGEDTETIFRNVETSTSSQDVQNVLNLPYTPCILVCGGTILTSENYLVLIDGVVVNDDSNTFWDAFLMLFASFFIFNIKYPTEAATTLEFIQRCFLGINPSRGSKKLKTPKDGLSPRVLSLINNISNYEWL